MYDYDFERREKQFQAQKYDEQQRRERFKRAAMPFIERGASFWEFGDTFDVRDGDQQLYEELRAEVEKQKQLDAAFLEGFRKGY